jgi:hypothetical protein
MRMIIIACFIVGLTFLGRVKNRNEHDGIVTALSLTFMVGSEIINLIHPSELIFHIMIVSIGIFALYLVLPNRFI